MNKKLPSFQIDYHAEEFPDNANPSRHMDRQCRTGEQHRHQHPCFQAPFGIYYLAQ